MAGYDRRPFMTMTQMGMWNVNVKRNHKTDSNNNNEKKKCEVSKE